MKYYIISGEASGDLHGSNLMKSLKAKDENADFRFWGGDHMLNVDENIITHIRDTSIMGFVEVAKNISKISAFFKKAKSTILEFQPDVVILLDYPGFNLRMAKWAKKKGFKTVYYISPQLWAWKKGRIKTIQKFVDEMIVILPFEKDFYKRNGVNVHYVGHPLVPVIREFLQKEKKSDTQKSKKTIAILPGSRKQEIKKILPILVKSALHFRDEYEIEIAVAPTVELDFYTELLGGVDEAVKLVVDGTYALLSKADLALVTSGTATLETALFQVPQVVCYKTARVNYEIGKRLVDLEFISLVNLIGGKEIVPELIQNELTEENLIKEIQNIQANPDIQESYLYLSKLLQMDELPHDKAADIVLKCLRS